MQKKRGDGEMENKRKEYEKKMYQVTTIPSHNFDNKNTLVRSSSSGNSVQRFCHTMEGCVCSDCEFRSPLHLLVLYFKKLMKL
jgi:hypothetical protein